MMKLLYYLCLLFLFCCLDNTLVYSSSESSDKKPIIHSVKIHKSIHKQPGKAPHGKIDVIEHNWPPPSDKNDDNNSDKTHYYHKSSKVTRTISPQNLDDKDENNNNAIDPADFSVYQHLSSNIINTKQEEVVKISTNEYIYKSKSSKRIASRNHPNNDPMFGSLFQTYLTRISIRDEPYDCILDTGSSDFAISADKNQKCPVYYKGYEEGKCTGGIPLFVGYGDGNWTGITCPEEVSVNGVSLGEVKLAVMYQTFSMLDCDNGKNQNCIIGLAFPSLLGPPNNYSLPFFNLLSNHTDIPNVYSMQCCGWFGEDGGLASGSLDFGGADDKHYYGDLQYSPITRQVYYGVELLDVIVGKVSVIPRYNRDVPPSPGSSSPASGVNATSWDRLHPNTHTLHGIAARQEEKNAKHTKENKNSKSTTKHTKHPQQAHLEAISSPLYDYNYNYGEYSRVDYRESDYPPVPETIVDSGTSNIVFTMDLWNNTIDEIKRQTKQIFPESVWSGDTCLSNKTNLNSIFPDVTVVIAGVGDQPPVYLVIPPCRYFAFAPASECDEIGADIKEYIDPETSRFANKSTGFAFSIQGMTDQGNILGQVLYEHYYIVHDNEKNRVGFAPIKGCKDSTKCQSKHLDWPGLNTKSVYLFDASSDSDLAAPSSMFYRLFHLGVYMSLIAVIIYIIYNYLYLNGSKQFPKFNFNSNLFNSHAGYEPIVNSEEDNHKRLP